MPIKTYLKNLGVTLKELADRLDLSRPTLDSYISMYENGQELPRDRYQIIFDELFSRKEKNREEFENTLKSYEELLDKDSRFGISNLGAEEADIITDLLGQAKKDLSEEGWDSNVYIFANKLLNSYRKETVFRYLAKYFITLNGITPLEDITEEEKPYIAILYQAFSSILNHEIQGYNEYYAEFLQRREELVNKRNADLENKKQEISDRIRQILEDASTAGIELTEKEIIERLLSKESTNG